MFSEDTDLLVDGWGGWPMKSADHFTDCAKRKILDDAVVLVMEGREYARETPNYWITHDGLRINHEDIAFDASRYGFETKDYPAKDSGFFYTFSNGRVCLVGGGIKDHGSPRCDEHLRRMAKDELGDLSGKFVESRRELEEIESRHASLNEHLTSLYHYLRSRDLVGASSFVSLRSGTCFYMSRNDAEFEEVFFVE